MAYSGDLHIGGYACAFSPYKTPDHYFELGNYKSVSKLDGTHFDCASHVSSFPNPNEALPPLLLGEPTEPSSPENVSAVDATMTTSMDESSDETNENRQILRVETFHHSPPPRSSLRALTDSSNHIIHTK